MREDDLNDVVWDSVKKLADLQKKKTKCEAERFTNMDQFMAGNLDKEVYQKTVDALIEKVLVYDPEHVEIRWKFSDEVLKLLQADDMEPVGEI